MKTFIGIDIGGTNTSIGKVSKDGTILSRRSFKTSEFSDGRLFADQIAREICEIYEYTGNIPADLNQKCLGIGIGAPNGNFHAGSIENPPNLLFKGITPLVSLLNERLKVPQITLTNDANAAAIGEKVYGAAQNHNDFIMVTLGTGLGSGVFVNGKIVYGHDGFAGELGHVSVIPDGRYCGFGRRGSLENYCSATGIRRTFFEMIAQYGSKTLLDSKAIAEITAKDIADAAYEGDTIAQTTMDFTGRLLGEALASAALITSPAAFFLFGGPIQAGEILLSPLRTSFEKHLIPSFKNKIDIIESALPPGDAAILGAAAIIHTQ